MLKMGSLFAGIGGIELGLERAFDGQLETVWQVEQNEFCQAVLERHWPHAKRYNDVCTVGAHNLESVDILCGGFPCQDISIAGKGEGLDGERSGLWWEFHRIINELRPRVVVMENVAAITIRGLSAVVGSLAEIGYDCQWTIISAAQCGAPHLRNRWFGVAHPTNTDSIRFGTGSDTQREHQHSIHKQGDTAQGIQQRSEWQSGAGKDCDASTNTISKRTQVQTQGKQSSEQMLRSTSKTYWQGFPTQSPVCRRNDGIPNRVDRLKALGNAVVPQCAEWVGRQIIKSNLLGDYYVP